MKVKIDDLILNEKNPRTISMEQFDKLKKSIQEFPEMMELRPIVIDEDGIVLGGNMRLRVLKVMEYKEIPAEWVKKASELTEEQKKEFIIRDNVPSGEWDWDILANEWEITDLEDWGVTVPTIKNTDLLSGLEYDPLYYEPKDRPDIKLRDCVNLEKFNAKVEALNEYDLTEEEKETLKLFAYRFIKIDFENVANFYSFQASEEMQKAIERLRLVLTDNGIAGFIEDDLLKILSITDYEFKNPDELADD
jgi:hypothetical protein